jgi:hypothetical protein
MGIIVKWYCAVSWQDVVEETQTWNGGAHRGEERVCGGVRSLVRLRHPGQLLLRQSGLQCLTLLRQLAALRLTARTGSQQAERLYLKQDASTFDQFCSFDKSSRKP